MARSFNGTTSDYVTMPSGVTLASTSAVTVVYWNNVTTAAQSSAFNIGGTDNPSRCLAHSPWSDSVLYWDYGDSSTNGRVSTSYTAYLGKWAHVGLVAAGSSGAFKGIYLNGSLAASNTLAGGPTVTLTSGHLSNSPANLFPAHNGSLGHFATWSAQLTANEISDLYAGVVPTRIRPSTLLCYYPLWGASTTEADLSGNVRNGTVTGTTVVNDPPVGRYVPRPNNGAYALHSLSAPISLIRPFALRRSTNY